MNTPLGKIKSVSMPHDTYEDIIKLESNVRLLIDAIKRSEASSPLVVSFAMEAENSLHKIQQSFEEKKYEFNWKD